MRPQHSKPREYFEELYREKPDPWAFETSAYEAEKYSRSLEVLRPSYEHALEIACSIGVFTQRLAGRCDNVLGIDISEAALERARLRCASMPNVRFARVAFPQEFNHDDPFDVVTCCEVAYYWSDTDFIVARDRIAAALVPGGDFLLVHYLEPALPARDADVVHPVFLADQRFERVAHERAEGYRLDLLRRR